MNVQLVFENPFVGNVTLQLDPVVTVQLTLPVDPLVLPFPPNDIVYVALSYTVTAGVLLLFPALSFTAPDFNVILVDPFVLADNVNVNFFPFVTLLTATFVIVILVLLNVKLLAASDDVASPLPVSVHVKSTVPVDPIFIVGPLLHVHDGGVLSYVKLNELPKFIVFEYGVFKVIVIPVVSVPFAVTSTICKLTVDVVLAAIVPV